MAEELTEEERKRVVKMLEEWEAVRAGANALKIIGEIIKWCLALAATAMVVLGIHGHGK